MSRRGGEKVRETDVLTAQTSSQLNAVIATYCDVKDKVYKTYSGLYTARAVGPAQFVSSAGVSYWHITMEVVRYDS